MTLPRSLLLAAASVLAVQATATLTDLGTLGGASSVFNLYNGLSSSYSGGVLVGYANTASGSSHAFLYSGGVMTDLGTLGGTYSNAYGVSANGAVVVGNAYIAGNTSSHAFAYSGGVMTDLGTLGGTYSNANGVSANGAVVVGNADTAGGSQHAFSYSGGVMTDLGTLGGTYSNASGVSANGAVVIGNANTAGNTTQHAFSYSGGVMTDLGTLGGSYSNANGVSANGAVVVGNADTAGGSQHAFSYSGGVMTDLGTLGGTYSSAYGVSANGTVVIGNANTAGDTTSHAFAYSGGVMTDLMASLGGSVYGGAFGVSDDGSVIVGYYSVSGGYSAFYYTNGTLTTIPALGGGTFSYATGVSGDGSTVYGNSNNHAFSYSLLPTTITTTINASDSRVTSGGTLHFQGGTLAPVGTGTLTLTNAIHVQPGSTGTLDATGQNLVITGAVAIDGTSLTLTGSATSTINLAGGITGGGGLINAGGTNTVWGSYAGATVVSGGKLINVGASQSVSNQINAGATLEFNVASGSLGSGDTTFTGAGTLRKTGAGTLMWGVTAATFNFAHGALIHVAEGNLVGGSNWSEVWTNNHSDLRIDAGAQFSGVEADVRIDRLLGAGTLSTGLGHPDYHGFTIGVDGGNSLFTGTIVDSSFNLGDYGKLIKVGSGELVLTGVNTYSAGTTLSAGALRAGNDAAFGAGAITLNAGILSSDGTTARTLANAIVVGGNITLGDATKNGSLTLAGAVDLGSGATLTIASDVTLGGAVTSSGALTKDGAGTLKLAATSVVGAAVVVSDGLLTNNGTINGSVTVAAGGALGGSGTINGAVSIIGGILAPGNSPGLQVESTSNTTLSAGSTFRAQLGGTTAGNGDGFHDQYWVQNGSFNLVGSNTLEVQSWLKADGLTTFVPARRDVFTVIRAANGITGAFTDITNADYSQWMLYDNTVVAHTDGKLYGTGLSGAQTFAAYGSTATRAAIGASLWAAAVSESTSSTIAHPAGFIASGSAAGDAAIGLLTAPDADAYLAAFSPELYLAAGDYALTVSRAVSDAAFGQASLLKTGSWTVGAGFNRAQHGYRGADASSNYELEGNTSLLTLTHDFGPHCSVGFFYGYNTGKTLAGNGRLDYRGNLFGLTSAGRFDAKLPITLKASVVATDLRFDAVRNGAVANGQSLRALSGQLTAAVELYKDGRLTLSPTLGFVQGRSTSAAFAEAGSGALLNVGATEANTARALAGVSLGYILSNDILLDASFAYEHEFSEEAPSVTASFAGALSTLPIAVERPIGDRSTTSASLGLSWKIDNSITLRLSAEVRGNRELHNDQRYNAGLNFRF